MGRIENFKPHSPPLPGVIVGRYRGPSGEITNSILLGGDVLDFREQLGATQLAERTNELAKSLPRGDTNAVAVVGIGFGRPSGLEYFGLRKDQAFEDEHPREPDGTSEGGEFAPKGGAGAIDSAINQTVIFKDLSPRVQKRIARKVLRNRLTCPYQVFFSAYQG